MKEQIKSKQVLVQDLKANQTMLIYGEEAELCEVEKFVPYRVKCTFKDGDVIVYKWNDQVEVLA